MNLILLEPTTAASPMSSYTILIIYAVIIAVFYFLLIRPQSKKRKQESDMRNSLEIGDEITTIGGIMGRVISIKEDDSDSVVIETSADRSKLRIRRWAISSIDTVKESKAKTANNESKGKKGLFGRFKKEAEE